MLLQRIRQVSLLVPILVLPRCLAWIGGASGTVSRQRRTFSITSSPSSSRLHAKKGFAKKTPPSSSSSSSTSSSSSSKKKETKPIYSQPALYDLAFGYRDFEEEVNFLWQRHVQVTGTTAGPQTILEVAAGPARHSQTALTLFDEHITAVHCVDSSMDMMEYAGNLVKEQLSVDAQEKFHYHVADMRNFGLSENDTKSEPIVVDTAWILLGSLQHMNTNDHVRACLSCLYACLKPGGTVIIELPHPRETFSMVECTRNGWKVPLEDETGDGAGELVIVWGDDNDAFDEITQVRQFTVRMSLQGTADDTTLEEIVPLRLFTAQEIEALAAQANFRVASMHGALEEGVSANDEDAAYRLVVVLQKV